MQLCFVKMWILLYLKIKLVPTPTGYQIKEELEIQEQGRAKSGSEAAK